MIKEKIKNMHIVLIGADIRKRGSEYNSGREELIQEIINGDHELTIISKYPYELCKPFITRLGIGYKQMEFMSSNTSIRDYLGQIKRLIKIFKSLKPDIVLVYEIKTILSVCIAASIAGVSKVYSVVNGSGRLFQIESFIGKVIRRMVFPIIKYSLSICEKVFFQNPDDMRMFINLGLVKEAKSISVNGSGVNMDKFMNQPLPEEYVFLMASRLLWEKGVNEYLEAARLLKKSFPDVGFWLIGAFDTVKENDIKPYISDGTIEYLGVVTNIKDYYTNSSVFVLPSYYREGVPRTILEAMSTGRPIITTDVPGCRETVKNGINGFLVQPRNVEELADKMKWIIEHKEETIKMGINSRKLCENKFDVKIVNKKMIETMELEKQKAK